MAGSGNTGLTRIIKAFGFSMQGLKAAYKLEEAFRQEVWLFIVTTPLALWLGDTGIEKALLIGSIILLLIVEILNSAIEATIDRFGGEIHELSGRAKDMGSAGVFLAMVNAGVIWLLVLFF
ncbi:MAG: diacylglycerol kinase [Aquificaceae bacterium]|nr:MAG: diacylglycerol kinase [Aquificaceae bacterium]